VGADGYGVDDVGSPDQCRPTSRSPDAYRICTANAGNEFCATIEIIDGK
jgi:hypothetical protein